MRHLNIEKPRHLSWFISRICNLWERWWIDINWELEVQIISEKAIEHSRQSFQRPVCKSTHITYPQIQLPSLKIRKLLHKNLRSFAYKIQLLQAIMINDK